MLLPCFQIQMEKLASRHAISELFNWISLMESVIEENEENLKSAVGSNVIQDYLQKYKVCLQVKLHESICVCPDLRCFNLLMI